MKICDLMKEYNDKILFSTFIVVLSDRNNNIQSKHAVDGLTPSATADHIYL